MPHPLKQLFPGRQIFCRGRWGEGSAGLGSWAWGSGLCAQSSRCLLWLLTRAIPEVAADGALGAHSPRKRRVVDCKAVTYSEEPPQNLQDVWLARSQVGNQGRSNNGCAALRGFDVRQSRSLGPRQMENVCSADVSRCLQRFPWQPGFAERAMLSMHSTTTE